MVIEIPRIADAASIDTGYELVSIVLAYLPTSRLSISHEFITRFPYNQYGKESPRYLC